MRRNQNCAIKLVLLEATVSLILNVSGVVRRQGSVKRMDENSGGDDVLLVCASLRLPRRKYQSLSTGK
ncbi:hypothetical protein RUM44_009646 [Polyplax serrata]|uniref:Secreted protein n=1 Tax=Polyplax serrata TaxID=468196 RepID=A0ABR1ATA6_POLSC